MSVRCLLTNPTRSCGFRADCVLSHIRGEKNKSHHGSSKFVSGII